MPLSIPNPTEHVPSTRSSDTSTPLDLLFLGLTLSSSWGNGHATTYRGLLRALSERGHQILFLERDVSWYASQRDLPDPDFCELELYSDLNDLRRRFAHRLAAADAVIVGSYVPEAPALIPWAREMTSGPLAFYDIDTPITLHALRQGNCEYLSPDLIDPFDLYLSFSGGRALDELENRFHARRARHLPCAVDVEHYHPLDAEKRHDLGYLGTYSADRQPGLESLLLQPARRLEKARFVVAGPQYPETIGWPANVRRIEHLPPAGHPLFYAQQRFTLNLTRDSMKRLGHSPSVRLFEAASCGTAILSDRWEGIEDYFTPGEEILLADTPEEVSDLLRSRSAEKSLQIGEAARRRVLRQHTPQHRAVALENFLRECGTGSLTVSKASAMAAGVARGRRQLS